MKLVTLFTKFMGKWTVKHYFISMLVGQSPSFCKVRRFCHLSGRTTFMFKASCSGPSQGEILKVERSRVKYSLWQYPFFWCDMKFVWKVPTIIINLLLLDCKIFIVLMHPSIQEFYQVVAEMCMTFWINWDICHLLYCPKLRVEQVRFFSYLDGATTLKTLCL